MSHSRRSVHGVSRTGLLLLVSYLALAAFSVGYPFYKRSLDLPNSELSGVPAIVVGLPWSLLLIEVVRMALPQVEGIGPLLFMTVPGMLLNAFLIYFLFSKPKVQHRESP